YGTGHSEQGLMYNTWNAHMLLNYIISSILKISGRFPCLVCLGTPLLSRPSSLCMYMLLGFPLRSNRLGFVISLQRCVHVQFLTVPSSSLYGVGAHFYTRAYAAGVGAGAA